MTKSRDQMPIMIGDNIMRVPLRNMMEDLINLCIAVEASVYLKDHQICTDDYGLPRLTLSAEVVKRPLLTNVGVIETSSPILIDSRPDMNPKLKFVSTVMPPWMKSKLCLNEAMILRYLEGLVTCDFEEFRSMLVGSLRNPPMSFNRSLKPVLENEFDKWQRRKIEIGRTHALWLEAVDFQRRPPDDQERLLIATGITATGIMTIHGAHKVNKVDAGGWRGLAADLKGAGLLTMPQIVGAVSLDAVRGFQKVFHGSYRPYFPKNERIDKCVSRIPAVRRDYAEQLAAEIKAAPNRNAYHTKLARLYRNFVLTDPRTMSSLVTPLPLD